MPSPEIALLLELVLDLKKDQTEMKEMTIENKVTLEEHARRSTSSEARLDRLEKRDWMVNGFLKISMSLLGLAATVIGIIAAIRHL